jgi:hypothetical protein
MDTRRISYIAGYVRRFFFNGSNRNQWRRDMEVSKVNPLRENLLVNFNKIVGFIS